MTDATGGRAISPIPLDAGDIGEEDMLSFIRVHIESILEPYADNVKELHKTVLDLSTNVCELQEKSSLLEPFAARMDGMQKGQDKLMQFAESTRQSLDGFIDESEKIQQERAKSIQNLEETLILIKSDMEELRKNGEDTRTKLVVCQDAETENRGNYVQLKSELHHVADNLKRTDETQAATIKKVDSHKGLLDTEIINHAELAQEQRYLRAKFIALNDETTDRMKSLNEMFAENQSQLKQYRKEFEQAHDATTQSLLGIKDELGLVTKEIQAKLDRIETDLGSQIRDISTKGKDLDHNVNKLLVFQGQQVKDSEMVRRNLGDLEEAARKHEGEVAALQTAMGVLPGRVKILEEEANFEAKKVLRVEKFLGLQPLTKENADPKRKLKKRASSAMLGEDQLQRKAWAAWMEAVTEAKQDKVFNTLPELQATLKTHHDLIESEKSKLHTTNDRVQSLEMDRTKLMEELQKLRDLHDAYWKGMTRGLKAAKKTMHTEGDGEMVPSATRLRNALPALNSGSSRPGSSLNFSSF